MATIDNENKFVIKEKIHEINSSFKGNQAKLNKLLKNIQTDNET